MAQTLSLEIVTPQKILLSVEADYVVIPGIIGELGVLPGHIPVLTELKEGVLSYKTSDGTQEVKVLSGYAEVLKDKITLLASVADA